MKNISRSKIAATRSRSLVVGLLLALTMGLCIAYVPVVRGGFERVVHEFLWRKSMDRTLREQGLEATDENRAFYLALKRNQAATRDIEVVATPKPGAVVPSDRAARPFSARWQYADLESDGEITIGLYLQRDLSRADLEDLLAAGEAGWRSCGIRVEVAETEARFREMLQHFDIALFFGHSNVGRGMHCGDSVIRMGDDVLEVPQKYVRPEDEVIDRLPNGHVRIRGGAEDFVGLDLQCKLFGYVGCRSHAYFAESVREVYPKLDLLLTHYVWSASSHTPDIVRELIFCLEEGRPLDDFVAAINRNHHHDVYWGRINEVRYYHQHEGHASRMFSLVE